MSTDPTTDPTTCSEKPDVTSDTPESDAAIVRPIPGGFHFVPLAIARGLERRLTAAQAALKAMTEDRDEAQRISAEQRSILQEAASDFNRLDRLCSSIEAERDAAIKERDELRAKLAPPEACGATCDGSTCNKPKGHYGSHSDGYWDWEEIAVHAPMDYPTP